MSAPAGADAEIVRRIQHGDIRAAARLITRVEQGDAVAPMLRALTPAGRERRVVGITGAPGVGKSTLVDQLVARWRGRGERVGVLAVDPSSPLSGGAILGDRVRMARHNADPGVFIRSMAARGRLGGLAAATGDALIVLEALPLDRILVETVGIGQSEVDILLHAHTVVVVHSPLAGDAVQAMKSGVIEIADIHVVNRMDVPGADRMATQLREIAAGNVLARAWRVPVLKTQAVAGAGIDEFDAAVLAHLAYRGSTAEQAGARRRTPFAR